MSELATLRPRSGGSWSRRRSLVSAAGAVSLVLASLLAPISSAGRAAAKPTLTIGGSGACGASQTPVSGLGPFFSFDFVYESLVYDSPNGTFTPGLATRWGVKPGNKVLTLTLRQNARFSDGAPLDASAVKTWLDWKVSKGDPLQSLGPVRSVEVLGKYRVRITLKTPNPDFVLAFSSYWRTDWGHVPSPRAIAQLKADPKSTLLDRQTFGAGAYVYAPAQSVTGDHCVYVPNRYYYDKSKIKWDKLVFKELVDPNAILAALKTGQIDAAVNADWRTAQAAKASGFAIVSARQGGTAVRFWDLGGKLVPALADVRVRRALNYAVDRKTLTRALCPQPGSRATSNIYPGRTDGDDPKYDNYYPYDPQKHERS